MDADGVINRITLGKNITPPYIQYLKNVIYDDN